MYFFEDVTLLSFPGWLMILYIYTVVKTLPGLLYNALIIFLSVYWKRKKIVLKEKNSYVYEDPKQNIGTIKLKYWSINKHRFTYRDTFPKHVGILFQQSGTPASCDSV